MIDEYKGDTSSVIEPKHQEYYEFLNHDEIKEMYRKAAIKALRPKTSKNGDEPSGHSRRRRLPSK